MFDARYLITLDGSRYFSSELVSCERCLSTTKHGMSTIDILQAAIVRKRVVLPLAPEFIRNSDGKGDEYDQAGLRNAGHRIAARRRMAAIIVADSLSKQPFVEKLTAGRFSFLLVAKPGDHKSLYQDVDGLRRQPAGPPPYRPPRQTPRVRVGHRSAAERQSRLPAHQLHPVPIIKHGEVKYRNAWVTDLVPTTDNIVQLVRAGRARWKIENEAFNTLKNQGYHLKHNFGHGDRHLSEAFFTLNLLAFFMPRSELVDGLYQRVRTFFSSRRAFWDEVRSAFRLFLFTSWDQVLERMNSPPEQLRLMGLGSSWTPSLHLRLRQTACRQLRNTTCVATPLALCRVGAGSLQRPHLGSGAAGDCLVLPYGPPATSWTASCRQFASFHAAKAAHRELLLSRSELCTGHRRSVILGGTLICTTPQGGCWYRTLSLISALALLVAAGAWAGGDSEQPVAAAATEVDSSSMEAPALAAMVRALAANCRRSPSACRASRW